MADKKRPPYTSGADLASLFERMRSLQDPGTIDTKWVENMGLASSQPTGVVAVLKWLGVVDKDGKSQGVWNKLRVEATREETLSELVKSAYAEVFERVDVSEASRDDLDGAFIVAYEAGDPKRLIKCFLALCAYAGIEVNKSLTTRASPSSSTKSGASATEAKPKASVERKNGDRGSAAKKTVVKTRQTGGGETGAVSVVLNVEIPADWSEDDVRKRIEAVQRAVAGS